MLPRSPFSALQAGGVGEDESESLQADVMRFMAILGLCLMVIFALVQSLPSVGETREQVREREAERAAQMVEIVELREQVGRMNLVNRALQNRLVENEQSTDQLRDTSVDILELQMQLQQYALTIETQNAQLQTVEGTDELLNELIQQREQLQRENQQIAGQLEEQQISTQAQLSEIAFLEDKLAQIQSSQALLEDQSNEPLEPPPVPETVAVPEAVEEPDTAEVPSTESIPEPATAPTEAEGFRLTFASNDAFFALLLRDEIQVFVISLSNEGYRLTPEGNDLQPSSLPSQVQDIAKASLPPTLLRLLSRQRLSQDSRWGVVLSSRVMQGINQARAGANGGTLTIDSSAGVTLR